MKTYNLLYLANPTDRNARSEAPRLRIGALLTCISVRRICLAQSILQQSSAGVKTFVPYCTVISFIQLLWSVPECYVVESGVGRRRGGQGGGALGHLEAGRLEVGLEISQSVSQSVVD